MDITVGVRFDTLGLSDEIMRALNKKGYEVSTIDDLEALSLYLSKISSICSFIISASPEEDDEEDDPSESTF